MRVTKKTSKEQERWAKNEAPRKNKAQRTIEGKESPDKSGTDNT
jgi:hypothetical protein